MKTKAFFAALIIAICLFPFSSAHAQVEQIAVDTGKDLPQGPIKNNGLATITDVAKPFTVTTKTLLGYLATDETAAGNWFAKYPNKVPPNAKLEVIYPFRTGFNSLAYRVVSGTNIIDVANILSAAATDLPAAGAAEAIALQSGSHIDTNGALFGPFNFTVYRQFTITYDARPLGGARWFQVTGMATCSAKGGKPNPKTEKFLETDSFSLIDGTGAGVDAAGTAFSLSGVSVTAIGSGQAGRLQGAALPEPTNSSPGEEFSTGAGDEQISAPPLIAPHAVAPHLIVPQITQNVALLIGAEFHQSPTIDKKGVTTINPPTRSPFNTATLLKYLAKDETLNHTWFANFDDKVPPGAKLEVLFAGAADFSSVSFRVAHGTNIVDVSNIFSAAPADTNLIADVGYTDAGGPAAPPFFAIFFRRYTLTYDARPVGDPLHFAITAMATTDAGASKPNPKGIYTELDAFALGYGSGLGVDSSGTPFFLTGVGLAATGKEKLDQTVRPGARQPD